VPYGTDIDRATEVVADEGSAVASDPAWSSMCLGPPEVWGVNSMDHESITIRLVVRTTTSQKDTVARAMRSRISARLQREGIVAPGPGS
jgi:small conductance mechanosensitive channel